MCVGTGGHGVPGTDATCGVANTRLQALLRLETAYSMPFNDSRALPPPRIGGVPPGSTQPGTIFNVGLIKTGTGSLDMALSWSGIKTPCKFVPQPIYLDELESFLRDPANATSRHHRAIRSCGTLSDSPWWALAPALLRAFPEAKFVLTRWAGGCERWLQSVSGLWRSLYFDNGQKRGKVSMLPGSEELHECAFGSKLITNDTRANFVRRCEAHEKTVVSLARELGRPLLMLPVEWTAAEKWQAIDSFVGVSPAQVAARRKAHGSSWPNVYSASASHSSHGRQAQIKPRRFSTLERSLSVRRTVHCTKIQSAGLRPALEHALPNKYR